VTRILAAAALCALLAANPAAQAIDHLTIVAPAAPGGGWDQTARALQHVVDVHHLARVAEVQNVPGAAGTIGLSQFVDAQRGNGRTLLVTGLVMVGATLWNDSPVSVNQATPIARLTGEFEVIAVPASSRLGDLRALINEFRRRPEAFAWGGGSAGGTDHILAGLVAEAAGVDPRRVNYVAFSGGGEAVAALIGGHVAAGISGYSEFAAHIASGRLRALAVSSPSRLPGIEVPTAKDEPNEVFWRTAVGKSFMLRRWSRAWTPIVELLAAREIQTGAEYEWDALPQLQISLSTRQHVLVNVGARVPLTQRAERRTSVMAYLLWDWFDGGFLSGW